MKIKTYTAPQLSEALAHIKKELGAEALILSTKELEVKGRPGSPPTITYEVMAASDTEEKFSRSAPPRPSPAAPVKQAMRRAYAQPPARPQSPKEALSGRRAPEAAPAPAPQGARPSPAVQEEGLDNLFRRELQELKRLVRWSAQSVPGARMRISDPEADALFVQLIANDVDESLARRIIAEAQEWCHQGRAGQALDDAARHVLRRSISVAPIAENSATRVVAAMLGPTGVGKTTTIAKVAARFALELGKKTMLITLDTYRIGAAEQLKVYTELIGLPLCVAATPQELDAALTMNTDAEIVLIDTVGRAHSRLEQMEDLAAYFRDHNAIEKHLVLSLATKPLDLHEIINSFERFGTNKLLFTKLDETLTTGAAANELFRLRKPLSYLTCGQNVPQDIQIPTPDSVAELIIAKEITEEVRRDYA